MTEEEKKALKYFNNFKVTIEENDMLFGEELTVKHGEETKKQITTILNLINKLQRENEELKESKTLIEKILDKGKGFTLRQTEYICEHYIPVQEVKDIQKAKEWALQNYSCDEADYKQIQAVGAWSICEQLLRMRRGE